MGHDFEKVMKRLERKPDDKKRKKLEKLVFRMADGTEIDLNSVPDTQKRFSNRKRKNTRTST